MGKENKSVIEMAESIQENIRNGIIDERDVNFFLLGSEAGIQIALLTLGELMLKTSPTDASYNYIRKNVLEEAGDLISESGAVALDALKKIVIQALPEEPEDNAEEVQA